MSEQASKQSLNAEFPVSAMKLNSIKELGGSSSVQVCTEATFRVGVCLSEEFVHGYTCAEQSEFTEEKKRSLLRS